MKQVKEAYVNFLNHCYVDTEVEMKEIYASNHMWTVFEKSFLSDMNRVADQVASSTITVSSSSLSTVTNLTRTKSHRQLAKYVCDALITVIGSFFGSPFSSTAAAAAAAATTSSASSTEHHHHQHRLQTGIEDSSSNSSSAVTITAALAANTNTAAAVQVSILTQNKCKKIPLCKLYTKHFFVCIQHIFLNIF